MGNPVVRQCVSLVCLVVIAGCSQAPGVPGLQSAASTNAFAGRGVHPLSFRVLHRFKGSPDGRWLDDELLDVNGTLYGATLFGGTADRGTVFKIAALGGEEHSLHSFGAGSDGRYPSAGLIHVKGTLYGTTVNGGTSGNGTLFTITTDGREQVLYDFGSYPNDGTHPYSSLTNLSGALYGTTIDGGTSNRGPVFSIGALGGEQVLHSFGGGSDGEAPLASLIDVGGTLYGTTVAGGGASNCAGGCGTVFSITTGGTERVLHRFAGGADGARPRASLINVNGTLYGTTKEGGSSNFGTAFSITTVGLEKVIYSFRGGSDGAYPNGSLLAVNGVLYGTTDEGGSFNRGTVFTIGDFGKEGVLHSFAFDEGDHPQAGFIHINGTLYTTTQGGGQGGGPCSNRGCGTIFALTP